MELLFESRLEIGAVGGKVYAFQTAPHLHPEPVVVPDTPSDGTGCSIYGTVLRDGGRLRMWYQAWPREWNGDDASCVGYAESDDGVSWVKPRMSVQPFASQQSNLVNLGVHCPSVFMDPDAPSDRRYGATGFIRPGRANVNPAASQRGYFVAWSADGIQWRLASSEPQWPGGDVITTIYHPAQRRVLVCLKQPVRVRQVFRRSIWNAEGRDGRWSDAVCAFVPDDYDDVAAMARGYASADYYGMGMMPAGSGTVGFLWPFRHSLPRTPGRETGIFGACDVSLAYQPAPGARWLHTPGRPDFISHTSLPWTSGGVYTSSCPVEVGDEQRLYFCGARLNHGFGLDQNWKPVPAEQQEMASGGFVRIGFARWPRYRLFGFRSEPTGYLRLDLGQIAGPFELLLNCRTSAVGSVRAEVSDMPGRAVADSIPLVGDHLAALAAWKDGTLVVPRPQQGVSVYLHLDHAEIYAYDLRPCPRPRGG
jgi:hypothetical protein